MNFRTLLILCLLLCCGKSKQSSHESQFKQNASRSKKPTLNPENYNVAFLIMDGTYNTEFTAPYDIFQHTIFRDSIKAMNVFTVADTYEAIETFEGLKILPNYNYLKDTLPKIDILVIPSAEHHIDSDLENERLIAFVKKVDSDALFMTSHCDGAFLLAKAGLLDAAVSTTFPSDIEYMRTLFPTLDIRKRRAICS